MVPRGGAVSYERGTPVALPRSKGAPGLMRRASWYIYIYIYIYILYIAPGFMGRPTTPYTASERSENNFKRYKDFYLKAKVWIWP